MSLPRVLQWVRGYLDGKYAVCGARKWCVDVVVSTLRDELQEALRQLARSQSNSRRAIGLDGADDDPALQAALLALRDQLMFHADPLQRPAIFVPGLVLCCVLLVAMSSIFVLGLMWRVLSKNLRLLLVLAGAALTALVRLTYWSFVARDHVARQLPNDSRAFVNLVGTHVVSLVLVGTMLVFLWLWYD